jgi:phosphoenolpyruvate---glycerone phosphotransferase subunit DhaL
MDALSQKDIAAIVDRISATMAEKKDELIRLDGAMGDGDLGLTMEKSFVAARGEAATPEPDLGKLLVKIGMSIARAAPSTMGTLVATGFMSGGKAVGGKASLALADMAGFFDAFVAGIMQRGKSKPGEKTIVDVLFPAAEALKAAAAAGSKMEDAFRSFQAAADEGLVKTREMTAQHGRQAYYQEQSKGKDDPGATAGTYILRGFSSYITGA